MLVNQVCADETACTAQTSLAMYGDNLVDVGHVLDQSDKVLNDVQFRACAILKEHVDMLDADVLELGLVIELRVEPYDHTDSVIPEVFQHVGKCRRYYGALLVEGIRLRRIPRLNRTSKRNESRTQPIEVALVNPLIVLILFKVECLDVYYLVFLGSPQPIYKVLDGQHIVGLTVSCISEHHERRVGLCQGCYGKMRWPVLDQHHVA